MRNGYDKLKITDKGREIKRTERHRKTKGEGGRGKREGKNV